MVTAMKKHTRGIMGRTQRRSKFQVRRHSTLESPNASLDFLRYYLTTGNKKIHHSKKKSDKEMQSRTLTELKENEYGFLFLESSVRAVRVVNTRLADNRASWKSLHVSENGEN
jgi:hypothetical protein